MSFFGSNPTRPDVKNRQESSGERAPRSEAVFLGEVGKQTSVTAEPFAGEARSFGQTGPTPAEKCTNIVAAGAKWKGSLTVDDSVRIEGNFAGEIQAKGTVHVTDGALVDAKVRAAFVVVSGSFQGEIRCEQRVDLLPRSRVNGEVITKVLVVQEGAKLDGRVQMTGGLEAEGQRPAARSARTGAEQELATAGIRPAGSAAANSRPSEG